MAATVAGNQELAPEVIHSCPTCSHWLPDGTLACPDCQTLTYGQHLSQVATQAQLLEREQKWTEARGAWQSTLPWLPQETRQAASIRDHIAQLDRRIQAEEDQKAKWTKRLGPFAPIALFLLKAKSWLFLLLKAKFLFSFLAYFGIYWALFGPQFAIVLVTTVFLHEMGHYVAVKRRGLKADLPVFLPGLGAYVRWYHQGVSVQDLGAIALAGPAAGLGVALIAYAIYLPTHSPFFHLMAYMGAWINLFNLFPVAFLFAFDGAQAAIALNRMQRILVAATFLLFFGLTVSMNPGGNPSGPNTHWMFLILGLGMAWRALGQDAPRGESSGRIFAYFQILAIGLGALLLRSQIPGM
jgi:Zn-dependent protease/uncharacterized Zn finger protein (UPF0148 family)